MPSAEQRKKEAKKRKKQLQARLQKVEQAPKKAVTSRNRMRDAIRRNQPRLGRVEIAPDPERKPSILDRFNDQPLDLEKRISKPVPAKEQIQELLPPDASEDQKALIRAAQSAEPLMKRKEFKQVVGSLAAFRQCYAVAYRKLHEMLQAEPEGTVDPMVEDLLIQSAMYESSKAFNEHTLMDGVINSVLPWLAETIDQHVEDDKKQEQAERDEAEEARRATPIPLGFKHAPQQEDANLTRERGLVLVGWRPAVEWLLDKITEQVLLAKQPTFTVVRFMERPPKGEPNPHLIRLARNAWKGCCNTKESLPLVMGEFVFDMLQAPPDLLMCDCLPDAYTRSFTGRADGATAGDAHRVFSKWCKEACCAFVGGVPTGDKLSPDLKGNEFEQLRTFAHLRSIEVLEEAEGLAPDHYRIVVSHHAADFDVPKKTLDDYGRPALVLPS